MGTKLGASAAKLAELFTNTTFLKKHSLYSGPMPSMWDQCNLGKKSILLKYAQPSTHGCQLIRHEWWNYRNCSLEREHKGSSCEYILPLVWVDGAYRMGAIKRGGQKRGLFSRDCRPRTSHGHKRWLADYKPLMRSEGEVYGGTHRHRIRRQ